MSRPQTLAAGLLKAKDSSDVENLVDILSRLDEETITYNILKETKLGKICAGLKKHNNETVASKAKALVTKWKQQVSQQKNPNPSDRRLTSRPTAATQASEEKSRRSSGFSRPPVNVSRGDAKRDKVIEKFSATLLPEEDDEKYLHYQEVASDIEDALWDRYGSNQSQYLKKYRDLNFNLKDNAILKENILTGNLAPERLVTMTTEDLASETLKTARNEERDWALKEAQGAAAVEQKAMTDDYRCGKCKQRKCTYYQQQTRGADEPMTTFIRCIVCGNQWKN